MEKEFVKTVGQAGERRADFPGPHLEDAVEAPEGIGGAPR